MTLANQPRPTQIMPSPQRRSWLDILLLKSEPEPEYLPAPMPPLARSMRRMTQTGIDNGWVERAKPVFSAEFADGGEVRRVPKPVAYTADLLVMSTLDSKAPPAAAGAVDVLDAIVQDHLERATLPDPAARAAALAAAPGAVEDDPYVEPAVEPAVTAVQSAENLQKEIESLLAGEPNAAAPKERGSGEAETDSFSDFPAEAPVAKGDPATDSAVEPVAVQAAAPEATASAKASAGGISDAELEVLLQDQMNSPMPAAETAGGTADAGAVNPAPPATQVGAAASEAPDELESKLTEAEGVMAEELAQLMAETQAAETGAKADAAPAAVAIAPAASSDAAPVPAELAAQVQSIMDNPIKMHESKVSTLSVSIPAAAQQMAAPVPAAKEATLEPAATTAAPAAAPAASEPLPAKAAGARKANPLSRLVQMLADLLIMALQVLDMPFAWIKETEKNLLGIAAFLLLLGGVAEWLLSLWLMRH